MKLKFFDIAKAMSEHSQHHTHHMGAVIVKKNRVLSLGTNKIKTHPSANTKYKTIHAEFDAIFGLSKEELEGADIYIYRQHRNGMPACSKPCLHCAELIDLAKIKNVYYTDNGTFCKLEGTNGR